MSSLETNEKIKNLSEEIEDIKKNLMEINRTGKCSNWSEKRIDELSSRVEMTEKKISELEDRSVEFTLSEQQRENRLKKMNRISGTRDNIYIIRVLKREERMQLKT